MDPRPRPLRALPAGSPVTTRRPAARLTAGAFALALALAGCSPFAAGGPGGSADSSALPSAAATAIPPPTPPPSPPPLTPDFVARLDATLASARVAAKVPGVQAVVSFDKGWTWNGANGSAVVSTNSSVGGATLFEIGSVTKTFVAAATMQLVDEGVLTLDDPVTKWLPKTSWSSVTIRQLLSHTSGIGDVFRNNAFITLLDRNRAKSFSAAQALGYVPKSTSAPGAGFAYSNTNFIILGEILAAATGKPAAVVIRERLLDPLGLAHTFVQGAETPAAGTLAHGYDPAAVGQSVGRDLTGSYAIIPFPSIATACGSAGAMVSTASDLGRWAQALYGGHVVSAASLRQMTDFGLTAPFKPLYVYGLGTMQHTLLGRTSYGHSGRISGFRAAMRYLPTEGVTVTVLVNAGAGDPDVIAEQLLAVAFDGMGIPATPIGTPAPSTLSTEPIPSASPSPTASSR